MPRYAYYDNTITPMSPVKSWFDTDLFHYDDLPPSSQLLLIEGEELDFLNSQKIPVPLAVQDGHLVVYIPPAIKSPTLAQQAATMLQTGIQVTCQSHISLNGTYPCTTEINNEEGNILSALANGLIIPNNIVVRLDINGNPHMFSIDKFKALCQAKLIFQMTLNTIIGSNQGALPPQPTPI